MTSRAPTAGDEHGPPPADAASDAALTPLLERTREGDRAALEALLRALLPRLRGWLVRLLGPRADVDDATQDLLIALAEALPRFRGDSSCSTYCYRVTLRVASRYYGKRPRTVPLELVPPPADRVDPESRVLRREVLVRLYDELDRLPPPQRAAFVLCRIEGLDPAEAAKVCGVSSGALRVRLHRARKQVEAALARDPYVSRSGGER